MAMLPTSTQAVKLPAQTDWISVAKTIAIGAGFVLSLFVLFFAHPDPTTAAEAQNVAIATGTTLGVLRITDVIANVLNVHGFLHSPAAISAGVVPQAANTPLMATNSPAVVALPVPATPDAATAPGASAMGSGV